MDEEWTPFRSLANGGRERSRKKQKKKKKKKPKDSESTIMIIIGCCSIVIKTYIPQGLLKLFQLHHQQPVTETPPMSLGPMT